MGQQENRGEAGLSLGSLQKRERRRMKSRTFGKRLVREALFPSKLKKDVGESLGGIQAFILVTGLPN